MQYIKSVKPLISLCKITQLSDFHELSSIPIKEEVVRCSLNTPLSNRNQILYSYTLGPEETVVAKIDYLKCASGDQKGDYFKKCAKSKS